LIIAVSPGLKDGRHFAMCFIFRDFDTLEMNLNALRLVPRDVAVALESGKLLYQKPLHTLQSANRFFLSV